MKLKYTTLLFDLDGTLTDSGEGIINSAVEGLRAFGIEETDQKRLRSFIGPPLYDSYKKWYPQLSESDIREAIWVYRIRYGKVGMFENRVYDGIPELLDDLRAAGFRLVVATAKPETFTLPILRRFDLLRRFDMVYGCIEEIGRLNKTDVIRDILAENPDMDGENTLMIGDRSHDVEGAAKNGLDCVGLLYGFGDEAELLAVGAKYIAETVSDLRELLL